MNNLGGVLRRKKVLDPIGITETRLARVLNTFDLTALGVGSTLGVGVYVLAGNVAKNTAGPAVVLSFLIAAVTSMFAGLCYAEFGSRVPRAGSAYVYSYVTVGEFIAFIIGWNLMLEYVIGSASVARGLSSYLDTLINGTLQRTFMEIAPINVSFMSAYFDFFSFGITILLSAALAFGMKESSKINNIFTFLNVLVVLFVVIAGSFKANIKNWESTAPNSTDHDYGKGGFFPYGISGMIKGAATCFYGFVGFDCIATTGEEVNNPQRAIPLSIISSLIVIFLAYFSTATVVTLMVPYYAQDVSAPIPHAFAEVGWEVAKWIVAIGGIFGLCASLFGAMFPLPRIIYAMASDGVIFRFLGYVSDRFHTPIIGTLLAGLLTGLMSALFDLGQLVNMMSIGTLLAYSIVAACVLLLRYSRDEDYGYNINTTPSETHGSNGDIYGVGSSTEKIVETTGSSEFDPNEKITPCGLVKQIFNYRKLQNPTKISERLVAIEIYIFASLSLFLGLCFMYLTDQIMHARIWAILLISTVGLLMILILMSIATQPTSKVDLKFKVPLVPLIPALSILVNIYLMLMLDVNTWIRFGVWMLFGLPIHLVSVRCAPKMHAKHKTNNGNASFAGVQNGTLKTGSALAFESPKSPSPPIHSSPDSLSVNVALAALDEVLFKEEQASGVMHESVVRKPSVDTIASSHVHLVESVVALVHNEDYFDPRSILEEEEPRNEAPNDIETKDEDANNKESQKEDANDLDSKEEDGKEEASNDLMVKKEDVNDLQNKKEGDVEVEEVEEENVVDREDAQNEQIKKDLNDAEVYKDVEIDKEISHNIKVKTGTEDAQEENLNHSEDLNDKEIRNEDVNVDIKNEASNDVESINEASRSKNEVQKGETPYIPPPPSLENFATFRPRIHKVQAKGNPFLDVPKDPELNRSKSDSNLPTIEAPPDPRIRKASEVGDVDENIKFGSKQHAKVMSRLNKLFEKQTLGMPAPTKLTKPEHVQEEQEQRPVSILPGMKHMVEKEEKEEPGQSEVVVEVMKPADIKKKLDEILRSDPRLTMKFKSNVPVSNVIEQSEQNPSKQSEQNPSEQSEQNVSEENNEPTSVTETPPPEDIEAKLRHKNMMNNTLKSIKLRKVDSILN